MVENVADFLQTANRKIKFPTNVAGFSVYQVWKQGKIEISKTIKKDGVRKQEDYSTCISVVVQGSLHVFFIPAMFIYLLQVHLYVKNLVKLSP